MSSVGNPAAAPADELVLCRPWAYTLGWLGLLAGIAALGLQRRDVRRTEKFVVACGLAVALCALAQHGPHVFPPALERLHCVERALADMERVGAPEDEVRLPP